MKFKIIYILIFSVGVFFGCKESGSTAAGAQKTSPGGHPYTELKAGTGTAGEPGDLVVFHMIQMVDDSVLVDSRTYGQPQKYPIPEPGSRPMQAVEDILVNMVKGDSIKYTMAMDTMSRKPPGIDGKFFHFILSAEDIVSLKEFKQKEEEVGAATKAVIDQYTEGTLGDKLKTDPSGLKYVIHEEGTGAQPQAGQRVEVNYYGALTNGEMFDNSFGRGESFQFAVGTGQVIKGWDLGIPLLKEGGKATLFIPYELGYGEAGSPPKIPGKSELVFYVELIKAN